MATGYVVRITCYQSSLRTGYKLSASVGGKARLDLDSAFCTIALRQVPYRPVWG
jgi:hypothetical protein